MKLGSFSISILIFFVRCSSNADPVKDTYLDTTAQIVEHKIVSNSDQLNYSKFLVQSEAIHQQCLDTGDDMLGCSQKYYSEMDSMLNVVYNGIIKNLDDDAKIALKKEQLGWLAHRDKAFSDFDNEKISEISSSDNQTLSLNKKADFVKERVVELINYDKK